ncbi:hypothetical protein ACFS32_00065 [Novosphingobium pokkalii]|uniref:hypothetical protein n=1 Tax=Novosphingobium pokkalii TaxID=1770194 RepID=UPI003630F8D3
MVIRRMAWGRPGNSGSNETRGLASEGLSGLVPDHAAALCHAYESLGLGAFWSSDAEGRLTYLSPLRARCWPPMAIRSGARCSICSTTRMAPARPAANGRCASCWPGAPGSSG